GADALHRRAVGRAQEARDALVDGHDALALRDDDDAAAAVVAAAREKGGQDGALGQDLAGQLVQLGVGVGLHVVPLLVAPGVQGGYRMSLSRLRIEAGSSTYTTHVCR